MHPIRRRQRRMRGNLPGPEGLARRGASAALLGWSIVPTMACAARLASAPSPCQRGSRRILRQAPTPIIDILDSAFPMIYIEKSRNLRVSAVVLALLTALS